MDLRESVRARAEWLGFDDCRITSPAPPDSLHHFRSWLSRGQQADMAYLERSLPRRSDLEHVLPGIRSVLCLAVNYGASGSRGYPTRKPAVALYAHYRDYHAVLGKRLEALCDWISEIGGGRTQSLWYVDTGPILERDLAQRAGLGFIGKHTNLIHRRFGNWCFLAEILTTLELEPDDSETNHCGRCTMCIQACPTKAIVAPFDLDARRCISYLTIENRGPIPMEFRAPIGDRLFGCDDCLAACPWNRFATEARALQEERLAGIADLDPVSVLDLTEEQFRQRFSGTSLLRTKRKGLIRNACVVLGNTGGIEILPRLEALSSDSDPMIAEHASWAADRIRHRVREE